MSPRGVRTKPHRNSLNLFTLGISMCNYIIDLIWYNYYT